MGLFRRLIKVDRQCGYVFQARPRGGGGGGGWLDKQPVVVVFRDGRTCLPSLPPWGIWRHSHFPLPSLFPSSLRHTTLVVLARTTVFTHLSKSEPPLLRAFVVVVVVVRDDDDAVVVGLGGLFVDDLAADLCHLGDLVAPAAVAHHDSHVQVRHEDQVHAGLFFVPSSASFGVVVVVVAVIHEEVGTVDLFEESGEAAIAGGLH